MDYFENLNEEEKNIANIILENSLNEAPTTSAGSEFSDELVRPLIYYVQEALTTKELVDVQPINFKKGKVFGMDLLNSNGDIIQGVSAVDEFNAAFSEIAENTLIPDLQLKLKEADVSVKTRKARLNYSQELVQDMKVLKFNLDKEKIKLVGTEIANGIDYDVIKAIKEQAALSTSITYDWDYSAANLNIASLLIELEMKILDAASIIAAASRKGMANFLIVPTRLVKLVSTMKSFQGNGLETIGAVSKIGKLGSLDVYADTFNNSDDDSGHTIVVGKKPAGNISSGVIYSPYKIQTGPEITDYDNFSLHQTVFNRYGITKVNGGESMYCELIVTPRDGFPFS